MWTASCTRSVHGGFWEIWKSQSGVLRSEEEGWLSLARSGLVAGATRVGGRADGKASIERLCLSPYVEKSFNSKVIKSFVPELRSRKCFSCFGIPMFYVYMLWTFYVRYTYPYHDYGTSFGALFTWPYTTYVLWRKQQAGNIHLCKNKINNSKKNTNLLLNLFILKYLLFSLIGSTMKFFFWLIITCVHIYATPPTQAGRNLWSIWKQPAKGLNSDFSLS